jgi:hypothetical protein
MAELFNTTMVGFFFACFAFIAGTLTGWNLIPDPYGALLTGALATISAVLFLTGLGAFFTNFLPK